MTMKKESQMDLIATIELEKLIKMETDLNTRLTLVSGAVLLTAASVFFIYTQQQKIPATAKKAQHSQEDIEVAVKRLRRFAETRDYITPFSKIYFDKNDEFLTEDALPELFQLRMSQDKEYFPDKVKAVMSAID